MAAPGDSGDSVAGRVVRIVATVFLMAVLVLFTFFGGFLIGQARLLGGREPKLGGGPTVLRQVQGLQELSTVKYHLERIVTVTDPGLLGDERLILIAHGIVKSGIDLSGLKPEDIKINEARKTAEVTLPQAKVFDVYLDETRTQVFMREKPFFRKLNKDLDQIARRDAVAQIKSGAVELGIKKDAQERAEMQVRKLLEALGYEKVEIRFQTTP
jgi:hypothetical protein